MTKAWSTPAHRPNRTTAWPLSFYNLRTDSLPAVTSGPGSTWVAEQAALETSIKGNSRIKCQPYRTADWDNLESDPLIYWYPPSPFFGPPQYTRVPGANYFVDTWPMNPTTGEPLIPYNRPVWHMTSDPLYSDNYYPHDRRNLWFDSLRSENSRRNTNGDFLQDLGRGIYPFIDTLGDRHIILWSEATNELVEAAGYTDMFVPGVLPPTPAPSPRDKRQSRMPSSA